MFNLGDLDGIVEEQPHSEEAPVSGGHGVNVASPPLSDYGSVPESDKGSRKSWKLYPSQGTSQGTSTPFTVQIRTQTS